MGSRERLHMSEMEDGREPDYDEHDESEEREVRRRQAWLDGEIPRKETLYRLALTILFAVVAGAVRTVLGLIVIFELIYALITRRPPGVRVRGLANQITTYYYRLLRYLTYNESRIPFPFSDFPEPLEPDAFSSEDRDSEVLDDDR